MRFSVGYQLPDDDGSTVELVRDYREHVSEVYFAWVGQPSGRPPIGLDSSVPDLDAEAALRADLEALSEMGVDLVLLLNAACYGDEAISVGLERRTCSLISELAGRYRLTAVTTTSPFIARVVRSQFPRLKVRASVNMRIGTVKGMTYLRDYFDGFYMQREFNRDLGRIAELREWCDANGKELHILVNSGCLSFCSFQSFHDNLVAHQAGVATQNNVPMAYPSPCWEFLAQESNWVAFLQGSWIRPEDLPNYERWFSTAKLATRSHGNPRKVLNAYVSQRFRGNLLDLMEPGYGPLFGGLAIDNVRFPGDWFSRTSACDKRCNRCQYCSGVLREALVNVQDTCGWDNYMSIRQWGDCMVASANDCSEP